MTNDLKNELADVLESLHEPEETQPEPEEKVEAQEEVVEEQTVEEPVVEEQTEEVVEEPTEETSEVEAKETTEPEPVQEKKEVENLSVEDKLKKENEDLRKQMEYLSNFAQAPKVETEAGTQQKQTAEVEKPTFVNEQTYDDMMSDHTKMNKVFQDLYDTTVSRAVEDAYKKVPFLVNQMVSQQTQLMNQVNDFYRKNEDLVPYKKFVGFVSNELSSKNPGWDYGKLLDETEKSVRERIRLQKVAENVNNGVTQNPAFAAQSKPRKVQPKKMTGVVADINDLLN